MKFVVIFFIFLSICASAFSDELAVDIPSRPYTVEKIEAFVGEETWQKITSFGHLKDMNDQQVNEFLEKELVFASPEYYIKREPRLYGDVLPTPFYEYYEVETNGKLSSIYRGMDFRQLVLSVEGDVLGLVLTDPVKEEMDMLLYFKSLQFLGVYGNRVYDLLDISRIVELKSLRLFSSDLDFFSNAEGCWFGSALYVNTSGLKRDLVLDGCEDLLSLTITHLRGTDVIIRNSPNIESIGTGWFQVGKLEFDDVSLSSMHSMDLVGFRVNEPVDLSAAQRLEYLHLSGFAGDGVKESLLPKNIDMLRLTISTEDLDFLTTAEHVESLDLRRRFLSDWSVIPKINGLRNLDAAESNITDSDIQYLVEAEDLRYLNLFDTEVSDADALSQLTQLKSFGVYNENFDSWNKWPVIDDITYFILPREFVEAYRAQGETSVPEISREYVIPVINRFLKNFDSDEDLAPFEYWE